MMDGFSKYKTPTGINFEFMLSIQQMLGAEYGSSLLSKIDCINTGVCSLLHVCAEG